MRDGDAGNQWSFRVAATKGCADSYWESWIRDRRRTDRIEKLAVMLGLFYVNEDITFTLVFEHLDGFVVWRDIRTEVVGIEGR